MKRNLTQVSKSVTVFIARLRFTASLLAQSCSCSAKSALLLVCLFSSLSFQAAGAGEIVDINKADAKMLSSSLIGVGPVKAQAIVDYRTLHGNFTVIEDLQLVDGIGAALFERIKPFIKASAEELSSSRANDSGFGVFGALDKYSGLNDAGQVANRFFPAING